MNILELLSKELSKENWNIEEKIRYIYLRSCQLFSYDKRYNFYGLFPDGLKKQIELRNKKVNLENLEDNMVICTSYSKEVFSKLLKELLNIDSVIEGNEHSWVIFNDGKTKMRADATIFLDLARVKTGLSTKGYRPTIQDYNFQNHLKQVDKKINYIEDEYQNYFLEERKNNLFNEFVDDSQLQNPNDYLIYKLRIIKDIFESYKLQNFSDSEFCISYLGKKFLENNIGTIPKVALFQIKEDGNWDFVNIYLIPLKKDILYFILEKKDDRFYYHEITKMDALNYAKTLDGVNKNLIYIK